MGCELNLDGLLCEGPPPAPTLCAGSLRPLHTRGAGGWAVCSPDDQTSRPKGPGTTYMPHSGPLEGTLSVSQLRPTDPTPAASPRERHPRPPAAPDQTPPTPESPGASSSKWLQQKPPMGHTCTPEHAGEARGHEHRWATRIGQLGRPEQDVIPARPGGWTSKVPALAGLSFPGPSSRCADS